MWLILKANKDMVNKNREIIVVKTSPDFCGGIL